MENENTDRELLKKQRKERKKLKKQIIKEEKLKLQSIATKTNQKEDISSKDLKEKGFGFNRHIKSNNAIEATLESLQIQKPTKSQKKTDNKKSEVKKIYSGNPLDASQPIRFKGKHREKPVLNKPSKLKADILKCEEKNNEFKGFIGENNPNNIISEELNKSVEIYIKKLVQLQDNAYFKDPEKIRFKKRYVCGFHELKKKLIVGKIKFFIIATNIKSYDPICKTVFDIISLADDKSIRYVYALKRSKLGALCKFNRPVSCFGVLNHQGAEEEYRNVLENVQVSLEAMNEIEVTETDKINLGILNKIKEVSISEM